MVSGDRSHRSSASVSPPSTRHALAPAVKNDTRAQLGDELIFLPFEEHRPAATALLQVAETQLDWLDRRTLALVAELPVYNPEANIYGLCRLRLNFDRAGAVNPTLAVTALPSVVDDDAGQIALR